MNVLQEVSGTANLVSLFLSALEGRSIILSPDNASAHRVANGMGSPASLFLTALEARSTINKLDDANAPRAQTGTDNLV